MQLTQRGGKRLNALVERLAQGNHPIILGGPTPNAADLQNRIADVGYVFIKFTDTQGGTDLGVRVDAAATDARNADFAQATGKVHIEGTLTLNFVPVRCIADIDLATLQGVGHLMTLQNAQT
jgi:hypothetical protein